MTSMKSLDKESLSSNCFSCLATPGALLILEELDDSLEQIGDHECLPTAITSRSNVIDEQSQDDSNHFSSYLIGVDASRNLSGSPCKNNIQRVHRNDFYRICKVGQGCFSDVHMVLNHKREKFALKALNSSRLKTSEAFLVAALDLGMEAKILSELDHENIIKLRGICSTTFSSSYAEGTDDGYFIILDLLTETLKDSLERWRKDRRYFSGSENKWAFGKAKADTKAMYGRMQHVALGIVNGMIYLHENGIVLQDLKPANVGFDDNGNIRLFDFGMARKLEDCDPNEVCGSPRYMSPEVMQGKGYTFQADVYSFGIILYELCSLNVAFGNIGKYTDRKEFHRLVNEHNMRPKLTKIACPLTMALIVDCWQSDPAQRPSFQQIYERIVDITSDKSVAVQTQSR